MGKNTHIVAEDQESFNGQGAHQGAAVRVSDTFGAGSVRPKPRRNTMDMGLRSGEDSMCWVLSDAYEWQEIDGEQRSRASKKSKRPALHIPWASNFLRALNLFTSLRNIFSLSASEISFDRTTFSRLT